MMLSLGQFDYYLNTAHDTHKGPEQKSGGGTDLCQHTSGLSLQFPECVMEQRCWTWLNSLFANLIYTHSSYEVRGYRSIGRGSESLLWFTNQKAQGSTIWEQGFSVFPSTYWTSDSPQFFPSISSGDTKRTPQLICSASSRQGCYSEDKHKPQHGSLSARTVIVNLAHRHPAYCAQLISQSNFFKHSQ